MGNVPTSSRQTLCTFFLSPPTPPGLGLRLQEALQIHFLNLNAFCIHESQKESGRVISPEAGKAINFSVSNLDLESQKKRQHGLREQKSRVTDLSPFWHLPCCFGQTINGSSRPPGLVLVSAFFHRQLHQFQWSVLHSLLRCGGESRPQKLQLQSQY